MNRENIIQSKAENFAIRIVNLYKVLVNDRKEQVLSKQLLRSGTSIGANITEAECGVSKADFFAKMYIAFKECAESLYWIKLLYKAEYINEQEYQSINSDCQDLYRLLSSITKSIKDEKNKD